jgi:arabinofuranosyltransferase
VAPVKYRRYALHVCVGLALATLVLFSSGLYANRHATIDDAFISYRYARNLARGDGLVFNRGEAPTEGFTSLLWVVGMAPAFVLGVNPVDYARVVSVVLALFGAIVLTLAYRDLVDAPTYQLSWPLPALLWLGHSTTTFHLMLGLETTAYTTLLMSVVWLFVRFSCRLEAVGPAYDVTVADSARQRGCRILFRLFLGACFLAGLTRPEGFAVAGLLMTTLLILVPRRKWMIRDIAVFWVGVASYFSIKLPVFGYLLPNSFHLKVGSIEGVLPGGNFVLRFLTAFSTWLLTALFAILLVKPLARARPAWIGMTSVFLFFVAFYLRTFPLMAWEHRYLVPYVFVLALGVSAVIGEGTRRALAGDGGGVVGRLVSCAAVTAIVAILLGDGAARSVFIAAEGLLGVKEPPRSSMFDLHYGEIELGKRLGALGLGEGLSVAFWDSGAIPFYSDCRFIDVTGLNDSTIARLKDGEDLIRYVLSRRPDVIIFATRGAAGSQSGIRRSLVRPYGLIGKHIGAFFDEAVALGYSHRGTFKNSYYDLEFFVAPSGTAASIVARHLPKIVEAEERPPSGQQQ